MPFECAFEFGEQVEAGVLVLADPAFGDVVDGDGVEVVDLLAAPPERDDEIGVFEDAEVFGGSLAGHVEVGGEAAEGLAVIGVEPVEERAAGGVGEGFEDGVRVGG